MSGDLEPMTGPTNAAVIAVDYQRARHQGGGRRRKVAGSAPDPSGALDVFAALLATGLVVAVVYLAADDPWVKRVIPSRDAGAGVAMEAGR
jgi:hypothetical protein